MDGWEEIEILVMGPVKHTPGRASNTQKPRAARAPFADALKQPNKADNNAAGPGQEEELVSPNRWTDLAFGLAGWSPNSELTHSGVAQTFATL